MLQSLNVLIIMCRHVDFRIPTVSELCQQEDEDILLNAKKNNKCQQI